MTERAKATWPVEPYARSLVAHLERAGLLEIYDALDKEDFVHAIASFAAECAVTVEMGDDRTMRVFLIAGQGG